jgi:tyrosyl-tRNA synthetase
VLHKEYGVELQVGGSDQWGNIISGVELIRRDSSSLSSDTISSDPSSALPSPSSNPAPTDSAREEVEDTVYGLTIPLLLTSTGEKFGKSAGNAIWLDSKMTGVFDFYQVCLNHITLGASIFYNNILMILQFFLRVPDSDVLPYLRYLTLIPVEEIDSLYEEHMVCTSVSCNKADLISIEIPRAEVGATEIGG